MCDTGPYNYHFVGGRRHYNAVRQVRAIMRRVEVSKRLAAGERNQTAIARSLGVHRSTISRDVRALQRLVLQTRQCPICGHEYIRVPAVNDDEGHSRFA
jgi:hypothetical protein